MRNFDPGGVSCEENIFVCVTHKCETELGIEENSLASDFDASANKELKEREPSKHALDKDEEKCPLDISTLPVGESEQKAVENEFRVQGNYEFYTWSTSKLFGKFINGSWAESVFIVLKMDGGKILMNFDPCGKWRSQSNKDDNRRKLRFLTSYIESSQLVPEIESLNLRSKNFQWRYTLVDNRAILLLPTDSSFNPISSLEILSPTVGQCFKILWSDLPQRKLLAISCLGIWLKGFPYKTITREAHSLLLWYLPKVHVMTMLSLFVPRKILYALSTLGVISLQSYDDSFVLNVTIGDKKFDKEWDMGGSATKSILFDIYLAHELRSHLHDLCVYGMLMVRLTSEEMKMTEENKSSLVSTLVVWVGNQRCDNTWAGNTIFTWDQLHLSLSMVLQFRFQSQPLSMQERFSLKRLPTVLSSIVLGDLDELESEMTKIRGQAPLFLMSVDHHVPRQHALIRDFSEMQGSTLIEELQSHILKAIVVTCTIILSTYSMIGKSEHEYEEAHVYLTDAFCTIGEHDELLEGPWHFNCYITRGRVILWEGWNDTNNTNMERKLIMGEMSVVIIDAFGNVSWKNGQLRESLKLFHNVVNGLDPPVYEIDLSAVYPIYKTLIVADSTLYHLLDDAQTRGIKLEDEFVILGADGDDAVSLQDILKMRVIFIN